MHNNESMFIASRTRRTLTHYKNRENAKNTVTTKCSKRSTGTAAAGQSNLYEQVLVRVMAGRNANRTLRQTMVFLTVQKRTEHCRTHDTRHRFQ